MSAEDRGWPPTYPTEQCRSCKAEIVWTKTARGTAQPIDAKPNPAGNVTMTLGDDGVIYSNVRVKGSREYNTAACTGTLYMPHHATCPKGREWRKKR